MIRPQFLLLLPCFLAALAFTGAARGQSLSLNLGNLEGPGWSAREVRIALNIGSRSRVEVTELKAMDRVYKTLSLTCGKLLLARNETRCEDGMLEAPDKLPVSFIYNGDKRSLALKVAPQAGELWEVNMLGDVTTLKLDGASLPRLAPWLPGDLLPNAGRVSGSARLTERQAQADLRFTDAGFADATGLHAGEKLAGRFSIDAARKEPGAPWVWKSSASWEAGAVFWDPLYVSNAGHTVVAEGEYTGKLLRAKSFTAVWPHLGEVKGSFDLDTNSKNFVRANLAGRALKLTALRELIPHDWLESHDLADLALAGSADLEWRQNGAQIQRVHLKVSGAGLDAPARRLSMKGLDVLMDYDVAKPGPFTLGIGEIKLRGLTAGPVKTTGEFRGERLKIESILVPMLDGVFVLNDIDIANAAPGGEEISAELRGAFTPLSMDRLTASLELLPMKGTISAVIPRMTYAKSTLTLDGALLFKVFDGNAVVDRIRLENPFGKTPRLTADLKLTGMDLEQATGAVKFGSITGKIDVSVSDLVMENWSPLSFEARVLTSPGEFGKRISQRAVQNISSIGGAGAGAAIQASFLRVVETFGYSKIGLSCRLVNGICELGGAENLDKGFYIVKGGGLPSVNVVGYNRRVGWEELLNRIRAVIAGNSKMVIQ